MWCRPAAATSQAHFGFDLIHDVCQVQTAVRVLAGALADTSMGST
jgi:hypothetical protein